MDAGALDEWEAELLDCLVDDTESTALVVQMLTTDGIHADADAVDRGMHALHGRGLVESTRAAHPFNRGYDTWWRLTDEGWILLAQSGRYEPHAEPLSGDYPPLRLALACLLRDGPRTAAELVEGLLALDGTLPPDTETVWPHLVSPSAQSADRHRAHLQEWVARTVGKLALDDIVRPSTPREQRATWYLTENGREQLLGSLPTPGSPPAARDPHPRPG